jgi:hypothetical protein
MFDPKCHELAQYFLPGQPSSHILDELAQHIQDAVEDYLIGPRDSIASTLPKPAH